MIQIEVLKDVIDQQRAALEMKDAGMLREQLTELPETRTHVLIISGIRRCGKSTLLFQLLRKSHPNALYLNFDDPRLYDFSPEDFLKLDAVIKTTGSDVLMFDEIQLVKNWERYVRQKLDENFQVFVTGSNATLLGREVGLSLTGRQITKELFPFSYSEYCRFRQLQPGVETTQSYLAEGGFPEYLKQKNDEILTSLLNDIITRDIAIRYNIRDVRTLQRLALYLLSNIGNRVTGNKLKSTFGISSATTILEYFSHFEESYLLAFVPMFDYSLKKQNINPKKVYAIDNGLVEIITPRFKNDAGHKLENLVFLALRRRFKEIYYFAGKGECDFLVMDKGTIVLAVQVCAELNIDNLKRETSGLFEAMKTFHLQEGVIVTPSQTDNFTNEGLMAKVMPFHWFAAEL
jgi:hypothetical protein